jgi:XapX domain-containing protein
MRVHDQKASAMKMYVLSLGAGLLVGVLYGLMNVRSPAPPIIALVGLLGILAGEQIPALVRHYFDKQPAAASWHQQVKPHMFGQLPGATPTTADTPFWMQANGQPAASPPSDIPRANDGTATPPARDPNA